MVESGPGDEALMRTESERRSGVTGRVSALALAAASPLLGAAAPGGEFLLTFEDLMMAAIAAGSSIFASVAAVGLLRSRRREREVRERLSAEVAALAGRLARAEALLAHDDQVLVVWGGPGAPTDVAGRIDGAPAETAALLDFAGWLHPEDADELAARVEALRAKGEAFEATVRTTAGAHIEAEGRCSGSSAILRLSDLSSQRAELARIAGRHRTLLRDLDALRAVLAAAPHPAWLVDGKGALTWVNAAYAAAVEKASPHAAVEDGAWFLEAADRMRARMALKAGGRFEERVAVVIAGERRSFDVAVIPAGDGAAGFATDVSEAATTARALDAVVPRSGARSMRSRPASRSSAPTGGSPITTPHGAISGACRRRSSTSGPTRRSCSTASGRRASCRIRRIIKAGRRAASPPTARPNRKRSSGTCRINGWCGSTPTRTRRAASRWFRKT